VNALRTASLDAGGLDPRVKQQVLGNALFASATEND